MAVTKGNRKYYLILLLRQLNKVNVLVKMISLCGNEHYDSQHFSVIFFYFYLMKQYQYGFLQVFCVLCFDKPDIVTFICICSSIRCYWDFFKIQTFSMQAFKKIGGRLKQFK